MRILFIGDIFGNVGRRVLAEELGNLISLHGIDICIANGENAAGGKGITKNLVKKLHKFGIKIITGGNHSMAHPETFDSSVLVSHVLRPLNLSGVCPGSGKTVYTLDDGRKIGVINLQGRTFMDNSLLCPFKSGMEAIEVMRRETPIILVDFHAEATSEKVCLAHYFDGNVSAVVGTHTHVQTADERILPGGTAFITDTGMTGPEMSAIGMKLEIVLAKYLSQGNSPFEPGTKGPMINAVVIDVDESSGKANNIYRILKRVTFKS